MSFTSPARVRFPRSNVTGKKPQILAPGSFAVNWADKKLFVGDAAGTPVRFTQWLEDWTSIKAYFTGDMVVFEQSIWRARQNIPVGEAFSVDLWEPLSAGNIASSRDMVASGLLVGGTVTDQGGGTISVTEGTGVIADNTTLTSAVVTWGDFTAPLPDPGEPWSVVALDGAGSLVQVAGLSWTEETRRKHIELATVLWDAGAVLSIVDASIRTAGTAETVIDQYRAAGGPFKTGGAILSGNADLTIAMTEGAAFDMGGIWRSDPYQPNGIPIPAANPLTFSILSGRGVEASGVTDVDPAFYDNGSALAPLPQGTATIQYALMDSRSGAAYVQYGQTLYADLDAALLALNLDWLQFDVYLRDEFTLLLGAIIAEGATTDLSFSVVDAGHGRYPFSHVGGSGSIPIDGDEFYLLDGSRPLQGNMNAAGFAIDDTVLDGGTMNVTTALAPATTNVAGDFYRLDGSTPLEANMPAAGFAILNTVIDGGSM